ncbi:MAG: SUMF1/EgtB/PvdO family nonheme iron enzyme [Pseudomonadota bacterium]
MRLAIDTVSALVGAALLSACGADRATPPGAATAAGLEAEPVAWSSVEGGCVTLGESAVYPEEGPPTDVCVEPFELSRTEITNAQFARFVDETGYVTEAERGWAGEGEGDRLPPGSFVFAPRGDMRDLADWWAFVEGASWRRPTGDAALAPGDAQKPVVHVTFEDAEAFAEWAGARLPTEAEWEFAARAAPAVSDNAANTWQGVFPAVNTAGDGHEGLAPVASYPADARGVHDMIGNAWEWTASPYFPRQGAKAADAGSGRDPAQPGRPVRAIKGGSYLCARSYCRRYRPQARQAQDEHSSASHVGFRIARDAPSAS